MSISCEECREHLSELLDAEASVLPDSLSKARPQESSFNPIANGISAMMSPVGARPEVAAHLATCPHCARNLAFLRSIQSDMHSLPKMAAPADLRARVRAQLEQAPVAMPVITVPQTLPTHSPAVSTPSANGVSANGVAHSYRQERQTRQPGLLDNLVSFFSRPLSMATGGVALAAFCLVLLTHEQSSNVIPPATVSEEPAVPATKTMVKTAQVPAAHQGSAAHKASPTTVRVATAHSAASKGSKATNTSPVTHIEASPAASDVETPALPTDVSLPRLDSDATKQANRHLSNAGQAHQSNHSKAASPGKAVATTIQGKSATTNSGSAAGNHTTTAPIKSDKQDGSAHSTQEGTTPDSAPSNTKGGTGMYARGTEVTTPLIHLALLPATAGSTLASPNTGTQETTTSQNPAVGLAAPSGPGSTVADNAEPVTTNNKANGEAGTGSALPPPPHPLIATGPKTGTRFGTPKVRNTFVAAPKPSLSFGVTGDARHAQLTVIAPQDLNDAEISIALSSGLRYTDQQVGGYRVVWHGSARKGQAIPLTLELVATAPGQQELKIRILAPDNSVGATTDSTNSPTIIGSQTVVLNVGTP